MSDEQKPGAATEEKPEAKGGEIGKAGPEAQEELRFTQKQLDAMINDAFGRGAGAVRKTVGVKNDEELAKLVEQGRKTPKGQPPEQAQAELEKQIEAAVGKVREDLAKQLEAEQADKTRWQTIAQTHAIDNALSAAAAKRKAERVDQVAALLRPRVRFKADASGVEIVDDKGVTVYGKDGKPISVDEYVGDWLAANSHFLPGGVKPGAGASSSAGAASDNTKTMPLSEFEKLSPAERSTRMKAGVRLTDG